MAKYKAEYSANGGINELDKKFLTSHGSKLALTNNYTKDIVKVISFLENRRILLKGIIRKTNSQKGELLNFLRPLLINGLTSTKIVLTLLAKSVYYH